jgi:chemotaxis family two-component system response regulator Rcp1
LAYWLQAGRVWKRIMRAPASIVLVEDNSGDVLLVRTALKEYGLMYELNVLHDGASAVEFVDRVEAGGDLPDVVLLDLNLPKRNGDEVLARLRRGSRCRTVPVIVMTSSDSITDRERAARLGADGYFRKPFRFDEFVRLGGLVEDVLRRSDLYPASWST